MSANEEYPDRPMDADPADLPHKKSRLIGGLLLLLGALMLVVVLSGQLENEGSRVRALVGMLASGGSFIGLGLVLFPWTGRMTAGFTAENNAMIGFKKLPALWKAWLVMALILTVGTWVAIAVNS